MVRYIILFLRNDTPSILTVPQRRQPTGWNFQLVVNSSPWWHNIALNVAAFNALLLRICHDVDCQISTGLLAGEFDVTERDLQIQLFLHFGKVQAP